MRCVGRRRAGASGLVAAALLASLGAVFEAPGASASSGAVPWTISTVAGNGTRSPSSGDGGPATMASMNPVGVAGDTAGNLFVADFNGRIRKVDTSGIVTTYAGGNTCPSSGPCPNGDGGPATQAVLQHPYDVAVDRAGDVYIAEAFENRIRKVDASTGIITTVAGNGTAGFSGDGGPATQAQLDEPFSITLDAAGNLYMADGANARIRKVDTGGIITTIAGTGSYGVNGDGGPATSAAIEQPISLAVDPAGNLFFAALFSPTVRKIDTSGIISSVAGGGSGFDEGGLATQAAISQALAVATDPGGNLYIFDRDNFVIRRVDASGHITTVAGNGYYGFGGDGGPAIDSQLTFVGNMTVDPRGNLDIPDQQADARVRQVPTTLDGVAAAGTPSVGSTFTYNVRVGPLAAPATGVRLADALPGQVTFKKAVASQGSCGKSAGTVTCTLGTLPQGSFATVTITVSGLTVGTATDAATISANEPAAIPYNPTMSIQTAISGANCGRVLTKSITFTADIGPCAANGLVIGADHVTVDLGGHKVFGMPQSSTGLLPPFWLPEPVGILLPMRSTVMVQHGTVSGFDAGLVLMGGGGHTVTGMTVQGNVGLDNENVAFYGDGIFILNSSNNLIAGNTVAHNGIYDNIGVWGSHANGNTIQNNLIEDSVGPSDGAPEGTGIIVNAAFNTDPNDPNTDVGHVITGTTIAGNTVLRSASGGMANINSIQGSITSNTVENSGQSICNGNGIGMMFGSGMNANQLTAGSQQRIENNQVHGNSLNGIRVGTRTTTISNNNAANNNANPALPDNNPACGGKISTGSVVGFDLHDSTSQSTSQTDCANNVWSGNTWGTGGFDPPCTATAGSGPTFTPPTTQTGTMIPTIQRPPLPGS